MTNNNHQNDDTESDHYHPLSPFLAERLPQLGLDAETYGPYLFPLFIWDGSTSDPATKGGDVNNYSDNDELEDEWQSVLELLRASSETHSDDETIWSEFANELKQHWQAYVETARQESRQKEQERIERSRKEEQEQIQAALAQKHGEASLSSATTGVGTKPSSAVDDATKKMLLSRYEYEEEDEDDEEKETQAGGGDANDAPLDNRQAAAQAALARAQELRSHKTTTKKEEQEKTKQAKQHKQQLKEERRKRATKGERKR